MMYLYAITRQSDDGEVFVIPMSTILAEQRERGDIERTITLAHADEIKKWPSRSLKIYCQHISEAGGFA
jgi:hypothetical protein